MAYPDFIAAGSGHPAGEILLNQASRQSQGLLAWLPAMGGYPLIPDGTAGLAEVRIRNDTSAPIAVVSNSTAGAPRVTQVPATTGLVQVASTAPVGDGSYFNMYHAGLTDKILGYFTRPYDNLTPARTHTAWVWLYDGIGLGTSEANTHISTVDDTFNFSTHLGATVYNSNTQITLKFMAVRATPALDGQTASYGPFPDLNRRWLHVAGLVDSHGVSLFLNGQRVARSDVTMTTLRASDPVFTVGFSSQDIGITDSCYMHIADARVYGRALSPGEIWELYDPRTRNELYQTADHKIFAVGEPGAVHLGPHTINLVSRPLSITGGANNIHLGIHQLSLVTHDPQIVVSAGPLPIGQSQYPATIDTSRSLLEAANNKSVELAFDLEIDALELSVTGDLTGWPAAGMLTLDVASGGSLTSSEICYYDGISEGMIYLTQRGVDGTTAKAFAAGSLVEMRNAARYHNVLAEAIIATQTEVDSKLDSAGGSISGDLIVEGDVTLEAGATMGGPLILSGPPAAPLHAATKAYVDSSTGGSSGPSTQAYGTFWVSEFGASGSAVQTTGSVSAFSNQVIVASAASFETGQGIYIAGAGASGGALITTVTAVSGTTITLATTAVNTVTNVLVQHDDTVALQAALNQITDIHTLTLLFDNGTYRINGPISITTNSILSIPYDGVAINGTFRTLRLIGQSTPVGDVFWWPSTQGTIIQTNKIGVDTNTSMLNARSPYLGTSFAEMIPQMNLMSVDVRDMIFRTYDNPAISALDLYMVWNCFITNVTIDTGVPPQGTDMGGINNAGSDPTHGTFGMRFPRACTVSQSNNLNVCCYAIGIIFSDLWVSVNCMVLRCKTGLFTRGYDYPITGTILIVSCATGIHIEGSTFGTPGLDCHVRWEIDGRIPPAFPDAPYWWSAIPNRYIYDPNNALRGQIRYMVQEAYATGTFPDITVTGATNLIKTNLKATL